MFKYRHVLSSLLLTQYRGQKFLTVSAQLLVDSASLPKKLILKSAARSVPSMSVEATVCNVTNLSSTVRGLTLKVEKSKFSFKPGQWVDLVAPGVKEVAGYSICSTPHMLERKGILELAVKYSDFPTTDWLHKHCIIGSVVQIAPGGEFCYEVGTHEQYASLPRNLLLIAGGVGINPLISIMQHVAELYDDKQSAPRQVVLAYTAASMNELVFRDDIIRLVSEHNNMSVEFYITRDTPDNLLPVEEYQSVTFKKNVRIDFEQIRRILEEKFPSYKIDLDCFVCGPLGLIDVTNSALLELGLSSKQIKFEKWW